MGPTITPATKVSSLARWPSVSPRERASPSLILNSRRDRQAIEDASPFSYSGPWTYLRLMNDSTSRLVVGTYDGPPLMSAEPPRAECEADGRGPVSGGRSVSGGASHPIGRRSSLNH